MPEKEKLAPFVFRRPVLASFGITCLYFFMGWLFFTPFFQSNDDMVMNWITQGFGLVDKPSEFLMVVNVLLGLLLKNLNLLVPHVPWFGLGLFSVFFLSVWALLAAFFSRKRSPGAVTLMILLGTPLFFHCFAWPQYTVYCLLAAQAGVFLLANPVRPRPLAFGAAAFLLFMASLIRLEPALFTLLASSVFLFHSFKSDREEGINPNRWRIMAATALLILLCVGFDRFYVASHPGWKEAREYYDKRFSIDEIKVTGYESQKAAFQAVGWEPEDYQMFVKTFYAGPLFSLENLRKLDGLLKVDLGIKRDLMIELMKNEIVQFVLLAFGAGLALMWLGRARVWGPVSWVAALVILLVSFNKIVARIFWPQLLFADLMMLFLLPPAPLLTGKKNWQSVIPPALVLLMVWGAVRTIGGDVSSNRPGTEASWAIRDSFHALSPRKDQLYIIWGPSFPFAGFPLFQTDEDVRDFRFFWMSWMERTPYGDERLEQFHIHDFLKDTVDRPDIFWLFTDPGQALEAYYKKKTGMTVYRELVFHGYFDVYHLVSRK
jgi:hypothetical protein